IWQLPMPLIYHMLFPSISTFETLPHVARVFYCGTCPPETHQLHGSPRMTVISGVVSSHRSGSLPLGSPLRTTWAPRVANPQGTRGHTDSSPAGSHNSTMTAGARMAAPPPGGRG